MGVGESCHRMSTVVRTNYATKQADVTDLEELEGLLSPFQVEKLTYFFNQFFDFNEDGKIDASDFAGLNERLRKVANWSTEDTEYINMVDNNRVFFECLLEQVLAERNKEGLEERSWAEALAPSKVVVDSVSLWRRWPRRGTGPCPRTVTTNWTTRATSCFSQTSCSGEQSMDQANTSSAALTIGT